MAKEKQIVYTEKDRAIVSALQGEVNGLTIAEVNEKTGMDLKPGSFSNAIKKGLIVRVGEREVERMGTREVSAYELITDEVNKGEDGKEFNYSDSEKAIMGVLKGATEPMTLAQIAEALGVEKLSSGAINALVNKKGNVRNVGKIKVQALVKGAPVGVYAVVAVLPAGFVATVAEPAIAGESETEMAE